MTEKERLRELLYCAERDYDDYTEECHESGISPMESFDEFAADYLISKGAVVPPCKVGDTVYVLFGEPSRTIKEFRVRTIVFNETNDSIGFTNKSMFTIWDKRWYDFFGKIIFTTREEAEKALEGQT